MNKQELLGYVAGKTGIFVSRLLIEESDGKLSVDVLNGTDEERWAAAEVLYDQRPAGVAIRVHAKETGDFKHCSICGERLKIVESRRGGVNTAKSRCSNILCKNGKHWMPVYRPETTRRPFARVALTVDRDENPPWQRQETEWERLLRESREIARERNIPITTTKQARRDGYVPVYTDGTGSPLSSPISNRHAHQESHRYDNYDGVGVDLARGSDETVFFHGQPVRNVNTGAKGNISNAGGKGWGGDSWVIVNVLHTNGAAPNIPSAPGSYHTAEYMESLGWVPDEQPGWPWRRLTAEKDLGRLVTCAHDGTEWVLKRKSKGSGRWHLESFNPVGGMLDMTESQLRRNYKPCVVPL